MSSASDFIIEDGVLKKYVGPGGDVMIPEGVSEIGDRAFQGCKDLVSVTIPKGVMSIGYGAFDGCSGLTSVAISEGVTSIGNRAFSNCGQLEQIVLPASLEKIEPDAIPVSGGGLIRIKKSELKRIEVDPENGFYRSMDGVLYNKDQTVLLKIPPKHAFTSFVIPDGVTEIGTEACKNCENLQQVIMPSTLKKIGDGAFEGACELSAAEIPESVTEIGASAFFECSLTSIQLPDGLQSIGRYAFCSQSIGKFGAPRIKHAVVIPKTVTNLGKCAFGGFDEITVYDTITPDAKPCGEHVDSINGYYNSIVGWIGLNISRDVIGCAADASWYLPHTIIVRSAETAQEKYRVKMPAKQKRNVYCTYTSSWGRNAEFNFPAVDAIFGDLTSDAKQEYALYRMCYTAGLSDEHREEMEKYLKRVGKNIIRELIRSDNAEMLTTLEHLKLIKKADLDDLLSIADSAGSTSCKAYLLQWSEKSISTRERAAKTTKETSLKAPTVSELKKLWSYKKLEDGTLKITNYKGKESTVCVPERIGNALVTEIGDGAFSPAHCINGKAREPEQKKALKKMSSVSLPDGIRLIEDGVFHGCTGLADKEGMVIVHGILFYCTAKGDVTVPEGVTRIAGSAFSWSMGFQTVTLPNSLESIGLHAFFACYNLTSITIPGSLTSIEQGAFWNCPNLTIHAPAGSYAEQYAKENNIPFMAKE